RAEEWSEGERYWLGRLGDIRLLESAGNCTRVFLSGQPEPDREPEGDPLHSGLVRWAPDGQTRRGSRRDAFPPPLACVPRAREHVSRTHHHSTTHPSLPTARHDLLGPMLPSLHLARWPADVPAWERTPSRGSISSSSAAGAVYANQVYHRPSSGRSG